MAFIVIRLALFAALLIYNCGMALESDFTDVSSDPNAPDKAVAATTYRDCEEYCASGDTSTGVKPILINGNVVNVFCYGCWTAIQSRTFGSMDFNLTFDQYRNVIGRATSPPSDFYLGNDNIYTLTNQKNMQLWVEIKDCDSVVTSETYTSFRIGNLSEKFSLHTDNVGGALNYKVLGISDNGRPFATAATYDPNGGLPVSHCPALLYGGWWFGSCANNLNGKWYRVTPPLCEAPVNYGIHWRRGGQFSYSSSLMFLCSSCPRPF